VAVGHGGQQVQLGGIAFGDQQGLGHGGEPLSGLSGEFQNGNISHLKTEC
jgi:hypothetical protein